MMGALIILSLCTTSLGQLTSSFSPFNPMQSSRAWNAPANQFTAPFGTTGGFNPSMIIQNKPFGSIAPTPNLPKSVFLPPWNIIPASPSQLAFLTSLNNSIVPTGGRSNITEVLNAQFDPRSFRSYNIEISRANWIALNDKPADKKSYHCNITTEYGTPQAKKWVDPGVGIRFKGSIGSLLLCLDENLHFDGSCRKPSFSIETNSFGFNKNKPFLINGMSSIMLNGAPSDDSLMDERTSYQQMRDFTNRGPRAVHAKVFVNGMYAGVFTHVQEIDRIYLKERYGNDYNKGYGNLYKQLWLNDLGFTPATIASTYRGGKDNTHAFIKEVKQAIDSTPLNSAAALAFFNKYIDIDSISTLIAFNAILGQTDDWRERHNFFLYVHQFRADGKTAADLNLDKDKSDKKKSGDSKKKGKNKNKKDSKDTGMDIGKGPQSPILKSGGRRLLDVALSTPKASNSTPGNSTFSKASNITASPLSSKLVFIGWDYDRIYDENAATRGSLKGNPWWDYKRSSALCNTPRQTAAEMAKATSNGSPKDTYKWTLIFQQLAPDMAIPVSCDKFTRLMALGIGRRINAKTRALAAVINVTQMQLKWKTWGNQISSALTKDPDGPSPSKMWANQKLLEARLLSARDIALSQANLADQMGLG